MSQETSPACGGSTGLISSPAAAPAAAVAAADDRAVLMRGFTHDIRQPLCAATSALCALASRAAHQDDVALLRAAEGAVREIVDIFSSAIDFVSLDFAACPPARCACEVRQLLNDIRDVNYCLARERGIELRVAGAAVTVVSNRTALRRIVNNLVVNALSHARASRVLVCVRSTGAGCSIEVRDNGSGISRADLEDIFKLGWRGVASRRGATSGHGLGLYVAKEVARDLGASVRVFSELGRGTCFRVNLPGEILRRGNAGVSRGRRTP